MIAVSRKAGLFAVTAALLLAGCGGGGGSSGGSNPPPPPPTGGITRTGDAVAVGPITGFGSVIVNGVKYETDAGTTFIHDDNPSAGQDDFKVGETVLIKGTIDDNGNARATEVEFEDAVEGPVTSVDEVAGTFVVLGQTVRVVATTSIDDNCSGGLAGLTAYAQVEVSGSADSTGVIEATRVECKTEAQVGVDDLWEVNGTVSNLSTANSRFEINGFVVDYSGATMADFPAAGISEGDPVEAKGDTLTGTGALAASRVEYKGARFAGDDDVGDHMEIEGFITRFVSPTNFDVSGIPVKEITGTVYEGGSRTDLGLNLKVEVEGEFDTAGVLNATKIEIKSATAVRVVAALDGVEGNVLTILGITINTDNVKTRFEDKTNAEASPLLPALTPGDYLEVRGQELPAGQITAVLVERDDLKERIELRGFVEVGGLDTVNRSLTVLGATITTSAGTIYKNTNEVVISADAFWADVAEGSLVDAREDLPNNVFPQPGVTTISATELQLELE
jgi:cytoskeletal protein CcmA (bactofilin family)